MHQVKATTAIALGVSLAVLSGCASMEDMKRLEQAVNNAEGVAAQALATAQAGKSEAEQALATAQAGRSEAAKATQTSDMAMKTASEAKAMVEKAKKNPYLP